jgi:hypothetical protein
LALLWGAILALLLAVVQIGLFYFAGQLALTAAQTAVGAARTSTYGASDAGTSSRGRGGGPSFAGADAQARGEAQEFLDRAASSVLTDTTVVTEVDPATGTVQVTVTGEVLSLLPGVAPTVSRQAVGGFEQVTP